MQEQVEQTSPDVPPEWVQCASCRLMFRSSIKLMFCETCLEVLKEKVS